MCDASEVVASCLKMALTRVRDHMASKSNISDWEVKADLLTGDSGEFCSPPTSHRLEEKVLCVCVCVHVRVCALNLPQKAFCVISPNLPGWG